VINGIDSYDDSGRSVSSAGDVNGDGFDDLIIGALGGDTKGQSYAGESYVVFGSSSGFDPSFELSSLDGSNGFVINGIDSGDYSGWSVSSAGDVNGDGIDDLIIGASGASPNGNSSAGESYVVFGFSTNTTPNEINGTSGRDNLTGTDGNDVITGLQSRDTLTGGGGDDIFRYTALVDAGDIIRDFEVGSDKIDLAGVLDSVGFAGVDPIASGYVGFRDRGANTLLTVDPDGSTGSGSPRSFILVQGVSSNLLNNSENFIF
jgi:Ca2+-binding RTX toxin-like protein